MREPLVCEKCGTPVRFKWVIGTLHICAPEPAHAGESFKTESGREYVVVCVRGAELIAKDRGGKP